MIQDLLESNMKERSERLRFGGDDLKWQQNFGSEACSIGEHDKKAVSGPEKRLDKLSECV